MSPTLQALAELLAKGMAPRAALGALVEAGGKPGAFAKRILDASQSVGLGPALAQVGAVTREELRLLGGTDAVGRGGALSWIVARRELARARLRACARTIVLPGLWAVATVSAGRGLLSIGGQSALGFGALTPLILLVVGLVTAYRYGWPTRLVALLPPLRFTRPHLEAEYAGRLAAAIRDGVGWDAAVQQAGQVAPPLQGVQPVAPNVSDALALGVAAGRGAQDLPDRLDAFAEAARARTTRVLVWTTRLVAWSVVFWVAFGVLEALVKMPIGGLEALDGLDLGGGRAGELDELLRELDL